MSHRKVVRSGEVVGVKVENSNNEHLGEIAEMVLDKQSGKVNYLVLDFGGFLGFGNKFFAVPWDFFSYNDDKDCFILNVDKQRLENAPGFDKDHWPDFSTTEFATVVSGYYNR